jgi:Glycosyl transferase family 11
MQVTHFGILNGKFGNHLFLIASTIGIAINNELTFGFPEWKNNKYFVQKLPGLAPGQGTIIREQNFDYHPIAVPKNTFTYLEGYFQSEKYFNTPQATETVRKYFTFKDEYVNPVKDILNGLTGSTCSIHVRRGDYLNYPDIHVQQPEDYWYNAQLKIESMTSTNIYIVMSDDIEWCKANKHLFTKTGKKVLFMQGRNDIDDFIMMTLCNNNIITNSTFSWWGAWLNANINKVVIMPKQWFGLRGPSEGKDLQAEGWFKV